MVAGRIIKLGGDLVGSDVPKKFLSTLFRYSFVLTDVDYGSVGKPVQGSFLAMDL